MSLSLIARKLYILANFLHGEGKGKKVLFLKAKLKNSKEEFESLKEY